MPDCLRYAFLRRTDVAPCGRCGPCLAGPASGPPPEPDPPAPEPVDEKTQLRTEAAALGIEVDNRWGVKRLRAEIEGKGHAEDSA